MAPEPSPGSKDAVWDPGKDSNGEIQTSKLSLSCTILPGAPGMTDETSQSSPASNDLSTTAPNSDNAASNDQEEDLINWLPAGTLDNNLITEDESLRSPITLLSTNGWIRTHNVANSTNLRIYVNTPLTHRRNTPRGIGKLRTALRTIMYKIDCSPEAWVGARSAATNDVSSNSADDESLWYIFNTLQNPNPDPEIVKDAWARYAMEKLLTSDNEIYSEIGLKTSLYPYQARSAAMMIQRESQPAAMLDPRLQTYRTPTGTEFYYDKEDACIVREKLMFSEACGGILAETMGCGKTLISLAVICATRDYFPKIPIEYLSTPEKEDPRPVREKVGSLMNMAAAAATRHSEPWKAFFRMRAKDGGQYRRCMDACFKNPGSYEIPPPRTKYKGRSNVSYPRPLAKVILLCSATLLIVPNNLVDHWVREIDTHTKGLNRLVLKEGSDTIEDVQDLMNCDIVLFSKTRFEREVGEPVHGRRQDAVQIDSPLTHVHWLRVIVDEGHNVAGHGSKTNMMFMLDHLHFERRWVISGTPSTGLYGVEVSLASQEAATSDTEASEQLTANALKGRRKTGNAGDSEMKDLDRLRRMVIDFLDLKPWSNLPGDDFADWTKYIKPFGADGKRRKTPAIRATLQGLVVRHQLDVINNEIPLPKLYNKVVYLTPTYYDRLSINLFLFGIAVNSITSEREGTDYIFHPSNRKHLNQTINNLRQAGFWWLGSDVNLEDTVDAALKYLDKNSDKMARADINQLVDGIAIAREAMSSLNWPSFKNLHELGVFVTDFPPNHQPYCGLQMPAPDGNPHLLGITQARRAQQYVTENLRLADPTQGLSGCGIKIRIELERVEKKQTKGAPESIDSTPQFPAQRNGRAKSSKTKSSSPTSPTAKPPRKRLPEKTFTQNGFRSLPDESPLKQTQFIGTASAKLTYLLDQVLELQSKEKIIIFYDNSNSAYWIAEGLEILGIQFRIYASTLKFETRTEYLKLYREGEDVRVLLMDLRQASHGLHIAQASRVFIVNPIWQPNVESQAIKRAHRIGQTRPVYVETLVLEDTLEDRMLRRRKEMSEAEMMHAEKSLLDDNTMSDIIQHAPFLQMGSESETGAALLRHPTGFFDRHRLPIPDDELAQMMTEQNLINSGNTMAAEEAPKTNDGKSSGKRAYPPSFPNDSDADEDASDLLGPSSGVSNVATEHPPKPITKKPRITFAPSVKFAGDEEGDEELEMSSHEDFTHAPESSFPPSSSNSPAGGNAEPSKKRVSFGP